MRVSFTIEHFENLIPRGTEPTDGFDGGIGSDGVAYMPLLRATMPTPADPFIPDAPGDADATALRALWARVHAPSLFLGAGLFDLDDVWLAGSEALVLAPRAGLCLIGPVFNWSLDRVRWYLETSLTPDHGLSFSADGHEFSIEAPLNPPALPDDAVILSTPGWAVFGHWILDFPARLMLAEAMAHPSRPLALPRIHAWMRPFLEAFHVPTSRLMEVPRQPLMRVGRAVLPSGTKNGFAIGEPLNRIGWHWLRSGMLAQVPGADVPRASRIFLTRRLWGSQRSIANIDQLEEIAVARGYLAVAPETLPVPAQARLFQGARIVVGQDGSALHGIVFCEPGARLGVIGTADRVNLWHAGLCQQLGHRVGHVTSSAPEAGPRLVDEAAFHGLLDRLESD